MNDTESNQGFDLACACKLGRILGGHDPVTAVRRFAPSLDFAVRQAALKVLDEHGGNYSKAAAAFGVTRGTFYQWFPRPRNIIRMAACLAVMLMTGCVTSGTVGAARQPYQAQAIAPALPTLMTARSMVAPAKTNGVVTLQWSNGDPAETVIVNQSTGAVYPATTAETLTVGGLAVGSVQTFVATNASGSSLPASVTVTPDTLRLQFQTWLYLTWPGPAGTLQRTTNLVIWQDVQPMASGGSFIVTNRGAREFYRVKL